MSTRKTITTAITQGTLAASLATLALDGAYAQPAAPVPQTQSEGTVHLPQLEIQGGAPPNTLNRDVGLDRIPGRVQDTPQTINVIPREVLREQNVTSLDQALRNVPSITSSVGEGGGVSGDQFRIRGFNAQNDLYVDGLRDFGSYQRDASTYEEVQVLMGPSGFALGGAGTVGGGVNVRSRTPQLGNSFGGVATGGMGPFFRGTADVNVQVGEQSAVRLNLMGQDGRFVDRDEARSRRWGVAPSVAG